MSTTVMSPFQEYIHLSRYSRFLSEKKYTTLVYHRNRAPKYRKISSTWNNVGNRYRRNNKKKLEIRICIYRTICKRKNNQLCSKIHAKKDKDHKEYNPTILCSAGIGAGYLNRKDSELNKFKGTNTNETYRLRNGTKLNLPIYYRNKIYTDEERENLWLNKLDKQERDVNGTKISVKNGRELYYKVLKTAQETNKRLGYGPYRDWETAQETNKRLGYGDRGKEWDKKAKQTKLTDYQTEQSQHYQSTTGTK